MKKVIFLCIVFIYNSNALFSQSQICPTSMNPWQWKTHSKWFHGEGNIITFPGGTGAPVASSAPTAGVWDAGSYESTASVCDENGNLLFYTNGEWAFDKTGATLSKVLLTGNENGGQRGSAVQGVMIVKHPLNINEYYIFTTDDAITGTTRGFNYFIYNKLTNTISGATRLKDAIGAGEYRCTEQVAATWHSNGIDIWITTHKSGTADLYSYLLKCSGISNPAAPVISSNVVLNAKVSSDNERSCLKFSWGGTKAAATAHLGGGNWDPANAIVLLNFNNTTGVFTKSAAAGIGGTGNIATNPYACEFSTDDSKLYYSEVTTSNAFYLSMAGWGNGTAIANSKTAVTGVAGEAGHLKIGGDGRMYKSGVNGTIGVISGTTYTANAITSTQKVTYSLPNMFVPPQDYLKVRDTTVKKCHNLNMGVKWKCKGTDAEDLTTANWSTVNPAHLAYITDKKTGEISPFTPAGTVMKLIYTICTISDTADVTITACGCPLDVKNESLKICIGNKVKMDTTVLMGPGIWTIDSVPTTTGTAPALVIAGGDTTFTTVTGNKIGKYKLLLKDAGDAACRDSIYITVNPLPVPIITPATKTICQGDNAVIFDAGTFVSYLWSENGSGSIQTTSGKTAGRYKVQVTDANGCSDTTSAVLAVKTKPVVTFGNDSICPGDPLATFDAGTSYLGTNFASYNWDNGFAATQKLPTTSPGKHQVFVSDVNGCKDTASAFLIIKSLPVAKVANQSICFGKSATFDGISGTGRTFTWTGPSAFSSNSQQITVSTAGTYTLKVDSNKCSATVAPILTVNNHAKPAVRDTTVCLNDLPVVLDATAGYTTYNWDNGTGAMQTYSTSVAGSHSIYVTDANSCKDTASIKITTVGQFVPAISVTLLQQMVCQNAAPFAITKGVGTSAGGKFFATCGSCVDQNTGVFNPALGRVIKPDTISYGLQSSCGDTASVYIQVLPVFTSVLSANKSLCPNEKYTIPATGWSPVDPQTLNASVVGSWKFVGAGSGLNAATGVFDAAIAGVGIYKITYGLDAPIYPCYVPDTMTITVVALPTANITGDSTVCANVAGVQLTSSGGTWWNAQGKINSSGYFAANGAAVSTYPIEYRLDNGVCKDTVLYQVRVKKVPQTDFTGDKLQGCAPMTTLFTDQSEEVPSASLWTVAPGSTAVTKGTASHTYGTPSKYSVSLQNTYSNGCISSKAKADYINVLAIPTVDFTSTPEVLSTMNPLASFSSSTSSDVTSMLWDFSPKGISVDATIANPDAIFSSLVDDTIPVQLAVSNGFCADSVKHNVIVRSGTTIFVPNAFSPNDDDINDEFLPRGINMGDNGYEFVVFNRWGEVIFKTNNATEGWKGKRDNNMHDAQIDVYIWRVTYVDHFTGIKQEPLVGHVALIR